MRQPPTQPSCQGLEKNKPLLTHNSQSSPGFLPHNWNRKGLPLLTLFTAWSRESSPSQIVLPFLSLSSSSSLFGGEWEGLEGVLFFTFFFQTSLSLSLPHTFDFNYKLKSLAETQEDMACGPWELATMYVYSGVDNSYHLLPRADNSKCISEIIIYLCFFPVNFSRAVEESISLSVTKLFHVVSFALRKLSPRCYNKSQGVRGRG